jgi:mono/diheme cytochrome c family protein
MQSERFALICGVALAAAVLSGPRVAAADSGSVERGKYLVEEIARCPTCHTPRDAQERPDEHRPLAGGAVPFRPTYAVSDWADVSPRLAGRPPGTDEQLVQLLMTGISRTGRPPRPPMPQFHMTRSDAEAVLAYLKSLPSREAPESGR